MGFTRHLSTLKKEDDGRKYRIIAADTETDSLGEEFEGQVEIVTFAIEEGENTFTFTNTDEQYIGNPFDGVQAGFFRNPFGFFHFIEKNREIIKEGKYRVYFHNLGFDMMVMFDVILHYLEKGHNFLLTESGDNNIIHIVWLDENGEEIVEFFDSYALFSHPLKKFTEEFSKPQYAKQSGAIDFEAGECFDFNNPSHVEYAIVDSLGLLSALINFDSMLFEHFGVHSRMTAASTAMAAWRLTIQEGMFYRRLPSAAEDMARDAYYGGYVALSPTAYNTPNVKRYHVDRNSSYPASMMSDGVPGGQPKQVFSEIKGKPGIYVCNVYVPEGIMPMVPWREKSGALRWPSGNFTTTLTTIDIANARKGGCEVKVVRGFVFGEMIKPFDDFIMKCRSIRFDFSGMAVETVAKLLQNSLYGKFGMKKEGSIKTLTYHPDPSKAARYKQGAFTELASCFMEVEEEERESNYMLPHWAAFITASARNDLHDLIREAGFENVSYFDTDSAVLTEEGLANLDQDRLGKEYGQWKLEKTYTMFRAIAPKVYVGLLSDDDIRAKVAKKLKLSAESLTDEIMKPYLADDDFRLTGAIKGIPKKKVSGVMKRSLIEQGEYNEKTYYASITSLATVFKDATSPRAKMRNRAVSSVMSSSSWIFDETTKEFHPFHIEKK